MSRLLFILLIGGGLALITQPQNKDKSPTEEIFANVTVKVIHNMKVSERSTGLEILKTSIHSCKTRAEVQTVIVESEDNGDELTEEIELAVIFNCENIPNNDKSESPIWRVYNGTRSLFRRYSAYIFIFIVTWHARAIYNNIQEILEPPEDRARRARILQFMNRRT